MFLDVHVFVVDKDKSEETYCQDDVDACQTFSAHVLPLLYSSVSNQKVPSAGDVGAEADIIAFEGGIIVSRISRLAVSSYVAVILGFRPCVNSGAI